MNRVFRPRGYFTVPDGTDVSAFLNATDSSQADVPWDALGDVSIAAGRIHAGTSSWIHTHPAVTQVTYVVSGKLVVRMQEPGETQPYALTLQPGHAAVSQPGTLFQLCNKSADQVEVLYIVSPSYVFEMEGDEVVHDDAILVARTWEEVDGATLATRYDALASRAESRRRLAVGKGVAPPPLRDEAVISLKDECDYLAPDGSEIRLLVSGERGGLAHCVLPKGRRSKAVRHRTVEDLWYVLEGAGEIRRHREGEPAITDRIAAGDSVCIPVGVAFQFVANGDTDLKLLLATMPPWPGSQEAVASDAFA